MGAGNFDEGARLEHIAQPVHVPPGGGDTVFFVGDTYGMFAEIGSRGTRGMQAPPLSARDLEALARVADKYHFSIVAD